MLIGLVKWFDKEKGFGVVENPVEGEFFLHINNFITKPEKVLKELAFRILKEVNNSEHLAFMHLLICESQKHPDLGKLFLANVCKPAILVLSNYLKQNRQLSIENSEAIARIFVGSLIHFVITEEMLNGKEIMPMSEEILIDTLINLVIK
jgi:hypothetical protein